MTVITSQQNDRIKLIRALQSSGKTRRARNLIVLEGVRLIEDVLAAGVTPEYVLHTDHFVEDSAQGPQILEILEERGVTLFPTTTEIMAHAAETETPQGILAVVPMPQAAMPQRVTLALILDAVADPGNLGTILRTAAAAGVDVVMLSPGCVDAYNPKVLRSGMGAHFRVPLVRHSWESIAQAVNGLKVYLAAASGPQLYTEINWREPSALIIGSEAHGATPAAQQLAHQAIAIPMANEAESINAAVATGVLLFEIRRQRYTQA